MSVLVISTFLAVLVLVAAFGVLLTLTFLAMDRTRMLPGLMDGVRGLVGPAALWLAFVVALTATVGSLYFSEVARFTPCVLCWYQRIAMYPLVVVLGIAAVRGDLGIRRYVAPIAVIGAAISIWHIGVERLPGLPTGSCSLAAPCDLIWVERFGFITIPVMALVGFLAVLTLLFAFARPREEFPA
ncbi:MAG TPA: disulfide oxidoreductase [Candidatus Angelobacter sp.]|nr:disulfide oxidoreductase [Candidatus Angelobacter sp.]